MTAEAVAEEREWKTSSLTQEDEISFVLVTCGLWPAIGRVARLG
jgi:hypothetical protein